MTATAIVDDSGILHPPSCPGGLIIKWARPGRGVRLRCAGCGAQRWTEQPAPSPAAVAARATAHVALDAQFVALRSSEPPAPRNPPAGRYVCGHHTDIPVRVIAGRARGCSDCTTAKTRNRRGRHRNRPTHQEYDR